MSRRFLTTLAGIVLVAAGCANNPRFVPSQGHEHAAPDTVSRVRALLPQLKQGMTQDQVMRVLADVPLGEKTVVSMTISGGETLRYRLTDKHFLELSFIPNGLSDRPPGGLVEAFVSEGGSSDVSIGIDRSQTGVRK
jgi:hypothetical protein